MADTSKPPLILEQPRQGGSYTRNPDGTLQRNAPDIIAKKPQRRINNVTRRT